MDRRPCGYTLGLAEIKAFVGFVRKAFAPYSWIEILVIMFTILFLISVGIYPHFYKDGVYMIASLHTGIAL